MKTNSEIIIQLWKDGGAAEQMGGQAGWLDFMTCTETELDDTLLRMKNQNGIRVLRRTETVLMEKN